LDLSLSLNARMGDNKFSVFVFPGKRQDVEKLLDWTPKLETLTSIFSKLSPGGITPTGPALSEALTYFKKKRSLRGLLSRGDDEQYFEETI
jgi:Ca-activated chloride channel homolog